MVVTPKTKIMSANFIFNLEIHVELKICVMWLSRGNDACLNELQHLDELLLYQIAIKTGCPTKI